jgi:hypothetical protein
MAAAERISHRADDEVAEAAPSRPWCVDDGAAIVVMNTEELRSALAKGHLAVESKTWRDGWPHWLRLTDVHELRESDALPLARVGEDGEIEESGMRLVERIDARLLADDDIPAIPMAGVNAALVAFIAFVAASGGMMLALAALGG